MMQTTESTIVYRLGNQTFASFADLVPVYRQEWRANRVEAICVRGGKEIGVTNLTNAQESELRAIRFAK